MRRPEGIPQSIWDAAEEQRQLWANGPSTIKEAIAQAMMVATTAEREACAKLVVLAADQCLDERNKHPVRSELRVSNHAAMTLALDLSVAIRKRGEE